MQGPETWSTSHINVYLGLVCLSLKTPAHKLKTMVIAQRELPLSINYPICQSFFVRISQKVLFDIDITSKWIDFPFKTPARPLALDRFIRRNWACSSITWYKSGSPLWNAFCCQIFLETFQAAKVRAWFWIKG